MHLDLLTATQSSAWILDVVFFVILLLGLLLGTWRGFIKGVCKLAGTIFALFVAFTFCNPFKNTLENWFGMTTAIANGMGGTDVAVTAGAGVGALPLFCPPRRAPNHCPPHVGRGGGVRAPGPAAGAFAVAHQPPVLPAPPFFPRLCLRYGLPDIVCPPAGIQPVCILAGHDIKHPGPPACRPPARQSNCKKGTSL